MNIACTAEGLTLGSLLIDVGRHLARLKRFLSPAADGGDAGAWIFAEDVASSVTFEECRELARLARGSTVLEIGSYYGRSTIALASTAAIVHSIDPHDGGLDGAPNTLPAFLDNLERYGVRQKVVVHVGLSTQLIPLLRAEIFDLVFIDAMHQRPQVDIDFAAAAATLRRGGHVAFHDYGVEGVEYQGSWHTFQVTEAVDAIAAVPGVALVDTVEALAILALAGDRAGEPAASTWQAVEASLGDPYSVLPTPAPSPIGSKTSST